MASAIITITASTLYGSTSSWWASMQWATASLTLKRRAMSAPMMRVGAFDFVVDSLAEVVEEAAGAGDVDIGADFAGDHGRDVAGLDAVAHDVLAVARAVAEAPEDLEHLGVEVQHACFDGGGFGGLAHGVLDVALGLVDGLFDPGRVDAAVLHEGAEGDPGDFAADRVEGADGHGIGRVVDDEVDASGRFDGADVAAFAADDPALHVVAGDLDDGDRRLRR